MGARGVCRRRERLDVERIRVAAVDQVADAQQPPVVGRSLYAWIAHLSIARAASGIASEIVGWGWMIRAASS